MLNSDSFKYQFGLCNHRFPFMESCIIPYAGLNYAELCKEFSYEVRIGNLLTRIGISFFGYIKLVGSSGQPGRVNSLT